MFTFVRNLAGFPANPSIYPLAPNTTFTKGDLVKVSSEVITKSTYSDNEAFGVMAESIAAGAKTHGAVYDNPFNVYRVPYSGDTAPALFSRKNILDSAAIVDGSSENGPLTVIAVDSVNETVDVIISSHTFTVQEIPTTQNG